MNTAIINSDSYEKHDTGNGHPEQPKRVIAIKEKLKERNDLIWEKPDIVPEKILEIIFLISITKIIIPNQHCQFIA